MLALTWSEHEKSLQILIDAFYVIYYSDGDILKLGSMDNYPILLLNIESFTTLRFSIFYDATLALSLSNEEIMIFKVFRL